MPGGRASCSHASRAPRPRLSLHVGNIERLLHCVLDALGCAMRIHDWPPAVAVLPGPRVLRRRLAAAAPQEPVMEMR